MQMINRPWGITVYSTASVQAAPDLVRLRFHVARLEQAPAQAFAAATEAVGAVRRAIRAHGVPDGDVQRSRLSLKSHWSYGNERKFLRAEARRAAVAAARRKAELYAGEAGVRLGAIVHIEDEDPEQVRGPYRSHSSARAESSEEDLAPGHVVVSAAVTLGFAIAHD